MGGRWEAYNRLPLAGDGTEPGALGRIGDSSRGPVCQPDDLLDLGEVQLLRSVGRLVIARVKASEQPHRRDAGNQERQMIAAEKRVEDVVAIELGVEL